MSTQLEYLTQQLQQQLPGAGLVRQTLPNCSDLALYLIDPQFDDRALPAHVAESISDNPPYWIFCWASGRALAEMILSGRIDVQGKTVLDFGAGSGVVAIAAKLAGAAKVTACDIDPVAHHLIALNSAINNVTVEVVDELSRCDNHYDLVLAADVLYERKNLVWMDELLKYGAQVIFADSRQKQLVHGRYRKSAVVTTTSFPDFAEARTYNEVNVYQSY